MRITSLLLLSAAALAASVAASAQQISGFSTVQPTYVCVRPVPEVSPSFCPPYERKQVMSAYEDTQEDYVAALYYNVQSTSALYLNGNNYASAQGSFAGNPVASGTYTTPIGAGATGLWTEVTNHIVDFFYISSLGEYYDPYGFSYDVANGNYDSGYWFSINPYDIYITEAAVIIGQSFDSQDNQTANYQGPAVETILYQVFIAPDWIQGPGLPTCPYDIYAGDNRGFNPLLSSYRGFQALSVGVGGLTLYVPPAFDTGYTFEFNHAVLQSNQIPDTAYNYDYLGQCNAATVNALGKESTVGLTPPLTTYNGSNPSTTFIGNISNPVPLIAFPINWNTSVTLSEPNPAVLHAAGTLHADCYPSNEVSVGGIDVGVSLSTSYDIIHVSFCLAGHNQVNIPISKDIPLIQF